MAYSVNNTQTLSTLDDLKAFLKEFFKGKKIEIYLFGSRARGTEKIGSDVDLAIVSDNPLSEELALLREIFEESNLPYKIDIVDLNQAPYLKEVVLKEGKRWL